MKLENLGACVGETVDGVHSSSDVISMDDVIVSDVCGVVDSLVAAEILVVNGGVNFLCVNLVSSSSV